MQKASILDIKKGSKTLIIGERVNPTGKPKLASAMRDMDLQYIKKIIDEQINNGSDIIDINVGADGVDEELLFEKIAQHMQIAAVPLCFDSFSCQVIEGALKNYRGRAIVNSASLANKDYEKIISISAEYGAMVILLPYVHKKSMTCKDRIDALEPLLECAYLNGLTNNDILIDAVVMAVAYDQNAPKHAIEFVKWCDKEELMTVAGISNISFGLPKREAINKEFLSMLTNCNLTAAIINPTIENKSTIDASYLLSGKDEWCLNWISVAKNSSL